MLVNAARHGRGLMLAPDWILTPYIAYGELIELLSTFAPHPRSSTLYDVHTYQKFVPLQVRLFIDFVSDQFSSDYDRSKQPTNLSLSDFIRLRGSKRSRRIRRILISVLTRQLAVPAALIQCCKRARITGSVSERGFLARNGH